MWIRPIRPRPAELPWSSPVPAAPPPRPKRPLGDESAHLEDGLLGHARVDKGLLCTRERQRRGPHGSASPLTRSLHTQGGQRPTWPSKEPDSSRKEAEKAEPLTTIFSSEQDAPGVHLGIATAKSCVLFGVVWGLFFFVFLRIRNSLTL